MKTDINQPHPAKGAAKKPLPKKDYENYVPEDDPDLVELFHHQEWCTKRPCICLSELYQDINLNFFCLVFAKDSFIVN